MSDNTDEILEMDDIESPSQSGEPLVQQNPGPSSGETVDQNPRKKKRDPDESLQLKILRAYVNRNYEEYIHLLKGINLDFRFGKNCGYMTLLEMALQDNASTAFAIAVIRLGANLNLENQKRPNKRAIHYAAQWANVKMLKFMIGYGNESSKVDINVQDYYGNTALHYLIYCWPNEGDRLEWLNYLLEQDSLKLNLNLINNHGFSPLHLAVFLKKEKLARILLAEIKKKVDKNEEGTEHYEDEIVLTYLKTAFEMPLSFGVDFIKKAEDRTANRRFYEELFNYLEKGETDTFLNKLKERGEVDESILKWTDPNYDATFLQYSCFKGYENVVEELLKAGADVHYSSNMNNNNPLLDRIGDQKPIILAYRKKHYTILEKLMERVEKDYLNADDECFYDYGNFYHTILRESPEHYKCFQIVCSMMNKKERLYLVNEKDVTENTPLHVAAMMGYERFVYDLVKCGSCIKVLNVYGYSPLKYMTESMVKTILDDKVKSNQYKFYDHSTFSVVPSVIKMGAEYFVIEYDFLLEIVENRKIVQLDSFIGPGVKHHLISYDSPNTQDPYFFLECFLLHEIRGYTHLKHLLTHPVLASFLRLKWERIQKYFYVNLLLYLLFCIFLTVHVMIDDNQILYPNKTQESTNNTNSNNFKVCTGPKEFCYYKPILQAFLLFLFLLLVGRELFQVKIECKKYFLKSENYLELILIILCILLIICDCSGDFREGTEFCPEIKSLSMLFSWSALLLLLAKHPSQSVFLKMFQTVSKNFAKFLSRFVILILAFVLAFHVLFKNCNDEEKCSKNSFTGFFTSIFKTLIMLTGEFESGETIPFFKYEILSRVIFAAFVSVITIIFMNLLNGLAVSDTQKIQNDSYLYGTVSLVDSVTRLEKLFLTQGCKIPCSFSGFFKRNNKRSRYSECFTYNECSRYSESPEITDRNRPAIISEKRHWNLYEYFAKNMVFLPDLMKEKRIYVLPNSGYQIRFRDPLIEETDFKEEEKVRRTYKKPNVLKRFWNAINNIIYLNHSLDEKIVKDLENILRDKAAKKSEFIDERIDHLEQQIEDLKALLKDKLQGPTVKGSKPMLTPIPDSDFTKQKL